MLVCTNQVVRIVAQSRLSTYHTLLLISSMIISILDYFILFHHFTNENQIMQGYWRINRVCNGSFFIQWMGTLLHIHDLKSLTTQFNFYLLFTVFKYCNSWLLPKWGYNIIADVRTQAMYQMMDEGFIGLIFSVFNEDKSTKVSWW